MPGKRLMSSRLVLPILAAQELHRDHCPKMTCPLLVG
jgi:hypothetical protein